MPGSRSSSTTAQVQSSAWQALERDRRVPAASPARRSWRARRLGRGGSLHGIARPSSSAIAARRASAMLGYWGWEPFDALFMVVITISGVGFGEVRPMGSSAERIHTMLIIGLGMLAVGYTIASFIQFLTEGEIQRLVGHQRMRRQIELLERAHDRRGLRPSRHPGLRGADRGRGPVRRHRAGRRSDWPRSSGATISTSPVTRPRRTSCARPACFAPRCS